MDFHQLIQQLRLDQWPRSLPAAIDDRGIRRHAESGDPQSKSLAEGMVIRTTISNASSCVALWQQPGRRSIGFAEQTDTSDSATIYFLGALGRRRCRKRTPGPPPLSSMNSTPAASKARRIDKSLGAVIEVSSSVSSARRIVATPTADSRARSLARHRRKARAARIWPLVSGFCFMLTP